jgi:hypothetical protein
MIADTTFTPDLPAKRKRGVPGAATALPAKHRSRQIRGTIISAGGIAVLFPTSIPAWEWMQARSVYRLTAGIVLAAADVDRELIRSGGRLGENDNRTAGFARHHREPLVSRDADFDRVRNLRRIG